MKTAIQDVLDLVQKRLNEFDGLKGFEVTIMTQELNWFKNILTNNIEKENKQIMDSWKEGTKYIMDINEGKNIPSMSAIDYLIYFKTEKKDYYTSF
jgi:hypothetical protein